MKLVQMPRALLTVEPDDLPELGVHPALVEAVAARCAGDPLAIPSLAMLGPRTAGTTAALMVLARRIGAALRDENIRLRDRGGDLRGGRRKLCYLPGSSLRAALEAVSGRRALESEAVLFLQDLDDAWANARCADSAEAASTAVDSASAEATMTAESAIVGLLVLRRRRGLRTFVTADPVALPAAVHAALRAELDTVIVDTMTVDTATLDAAPVDGRI